MPSAVPSPDSPSPRGLRQVLVEAGSTAASPVYAQVLWAGAFLALGIHMVYAGVFWALGIPWLAGANAVLALLDLGSMGLLRQGRLKTVEVSAQVLILASSAVNVLWLGWDSGFHYYILQLLPSVLLGVERPLAYKVAATASILTLLVGLFWISHLGPPPAGQPGGTLQILYLSNLAFVLLVMAVQSASFSRGLARIALQLRDSNENLNTMAYFDPLTGLLNRRALRDRLEAEVARCRRHPPPPGFVIAVVDIDGFKAFNDRWGHELGDRVLVWVASVLKRGLRAEDVACRWGGEEFLLLLTQAGADRAEGICERIREGVARQPLVYLGTEHGVTVTIGLSAWRHDEDPGLTIARADAALLEGKRAGKNRVISG